MTNAAPLVETKDLGIQFGGLKAVQGVDFSLAQGELRCLIGPNGAGKTTFFRLLTGVHRPSAGSVAIDGVPIRGLQTHQIADLGVGIKTQIPSLFDNLSVRENLWLSARRRNRRAQADRITDEVLETIRLRAESLTEVAKLSHGQRQWVELGVVIAGRPKLILLDEPAAGMTGRERERTAELIREINGRCAIIVVEHDMEFIKMIAKTITVFNRGQVLMEDTVDRVLSDQRVKDVYLGKQAGGVTL
ncbi:MAG TPA: ATP-binding cassette domain-containing protein [Shinella sp.]|jgi:branched-chain amino acid transport system ATP-binding protein/urea transport system ATP-binding protein|uniref:ATP-binding cassette domain-containing protein n=1 Tax=Shinella sp. TaxID=1870904 RepID=UPI0029B72790|nr:ATP-binding cassette domain-containing protein [Shinella sp.]MDX3975520.1 ATP-binding cassette domain-containing protein [Shinella sp.]HEV7247538.1 ATP-binding cassette domain-containing protein [Shinella sp.]